MANTYTQMYIQFVFAVQNRRSLIQTAWKDERLIFSGETLQSIAQKMERWYNVEIEITDPELKEVPFTGTFDNETIEQALSALRKASSFSYSINKNKITINR